MVVPLCWPTSSTAWDTDRREYNALNESRECVCVCVCVCLRACVRGYLRACVRVCVRARVLCVYVRPACRAPRHSASLFDACVPSWHGSVL